MKCKCTTRLASNGRRPHPIRGLRFLGTLERLWATPSFRSMGLRPVEQQLRRASFLQRNAGSARLIGKTPRRFYGANCLRTREALIIASPLVDLTRIREPISRAAAVKFSTTKE